MTGLRAQGPAPGRRALAMLAPQPAAAECAAQFTRRARIDIECSPCCRARWGMVQTAPSDRAALSAAPARALRRTPTPQGP
jgi:hypothetical protein